MIARPARARRMPPDDRRASLVDATLPLVLRHGAAVSTRQIAEAAGVAEGTIFRVFPDKEALLRAVMAKAFDIEPTLSRLDAIDRARPLRARLAAGVEIMQHRLESVVGLLNALGCQAPPHHRHLPHEPDHAADMKAAFRAAFTDLVGADAARLRVPPMELARVLRLLVFSGSHPWITDGAPQTAEQIVAIALDGLLVHHDHGGHHDHEKDPPC